MAELRGENRFLDNLIREVSSTETIFSFWHHLSYFLSITIQIIWKCWTIPWLYRFCRFFFLRMKVLWDSWNLKIDFLKALLLQINLVTFYFLYRRFLRRRRSRFNSIVQIISKIRYPCKLSTVIAFFVWRNAFQASAVDHRVSQEAVTLVLECRHKNIFFFALQLHQ